MRCVSVVTGRCLRCPCVIPWQHVSQPKDDMCGSNDSVVPLCLSLCRLVQRLMSLEGPNLRCYYLPACLPARALI